MLKLIWYRRGWLMKYAPLVTTGPKSITFLTIKKHKKKRP